MNLYSILQKPIVSEKSGQLRDRERKYLFRVDLQANKHQIKKAVEKIFGVKVEKVGTAIVRGRRVVRGHVPAKRKNYKKAVVTIASGDTIGLFEDN